MRKVGFSDCGQRFCDLLRRTWRAVCCCVKRKSKKGNKVSATRARIITVGEVDPLSKNDNKITTSKYTLITFLPKNLTEQFRRIINFYFLFVTIIAIVIDSPVSPMTSVVPLAFVVAVTAAKQGYEDWKRHRADNYINKKKVYTIHNGEEEVVRSETVKPGTLVRVTRGYEVPADLVLLRVSGGQDKCYVTTANLDGETNLKSIRVPLPFAKIDQPNDNSNINFLDIQSKGVQLEVAPPVADLYTFSGRVMQPSGTTRLTAENLMLRGSRVMSTEWAIGCAVYTGHDTKLALNSKFTSNKFSSSEQRINRLLFVNVIILFIAIAFCVIAKMLIDSNHPERELYLGKVPFTFSNFLNDTFSFLLLYYYIVPMSFYVTVEMYKFIGAMFIYWDEDFQISGRNAVANTSDLNEELGQVEVLFSDKTGTLTKNLMVFKACSINGDIYEERAEGFFSIEGDPMDMQENNIKFFMTMLGLCHEVYTTPKDLKQLSARLSQDEMERKKIMKFFKKKFEVAHKTKMMMRPQDSTVKFDVDEDAPLIYQGSSPDEKALVEAAARAGFTYLGEERNIMDITVQGVTAEFERLRVIEFNSERKRMSVILKDSEGTIWLFCKGADATVFPLCTNDYMVQVTGQNIETFSELGLRTLAFAYRRIPLEDYEKLQAELNKVEVDMQIVAKILQELESNLTLIGATAVEDCLQNGVAETLFAFKQAGIRTWILTGDKVETAINVSQSCEHLSPEDRKMMLIKLKDEAALEQALRQCETTIAEPSVRNAALIVDGESIAVVLRSEMAQRFVKISFQCSAVLCCRLSPLQKAEIVKLVKNSPEKPITAAIGDGANDISMIQEAHVGFGIYGKEGHQAARCADFAFTDFAMLRKMLLVLGHWYYQRLATLMYYFCYKNTVLALILFIFQFQSAFSTQSVYDSLHLTFFNLVYSAAPCLMLSLTEQRWPADKLMHVPKMYKTISRGKLLTIRLLFIWTFVAIFHSGVIYLFSMLAMEYDVISADAKTSDLWSFGTTMMHLSVLVISLKLLIETYYHIYWLYFVIIISVVIMIVVNVVYSMFNWQFDGDVLGSYTRLTSSLVFWALNFLVIVTALSIDFIARVYRDTAFSQRQKRPSEQVINIRSIAQIYNKNISRFKSLTKISSAKLNTSKIFNWSNKDLVITSSKDNVNKVEKESSSTKL